MKNVNDTKSKRIGRAFLCITLCFALFLLTPLTAYCAQLTEEEYLAEALLRKELPVQSNEIENWPTGPALGSESAILLEANTGVVLYAKNIDEKLYPASTTKLMTCLVAIEHCKMDEMVTFSHDAVFSIDRDSSNIGIDAGQSMPLEECLYGILVASANEVANAVAEHVAGSNEEFVKMMNDKAAELGCTNTHFMNAHGLYDDNHYTTAHDLAIIAKAFFQNELLAKISNTGSHHFEPTATQPDDFTQRNKHKLVNGEIPYEGMKGGKTGYTDEARQTLVTCATQNGMKLICVIMKEETPEQFYDTVKLFDYGFANFSIVNVAENETHYTIKNSNFFQTSNDIFGNSKPILSLNKDSYLIMPKTVTFEDLDSEISYDTTLENEVAVIQYYYHDTYVGTATIDLAGKTGSTYNFSEPTDEATLAEQESQLIIINVKFVLLGILIIAALLIIIFFIHSIITNYNFLDNRKDRRRRRKRYKRNRKDGPHFSSSRSNKFKF